VQEHRLEKAVEDQFSILTDEEWRETPKPARWQELDLSVVNQSMSLLERVKNYLQPTDESSETSAHFKKHTKL
jgi:hypothetical protein